eukprot:8551077-Heterocapsa_arctica.AAC.1
MELDWYCDLCGERKFGGHKICELVPYPGASACQGTRPSRDSHRPFQGASGDLYDRGTCPNWSQYRWRPEAVASPVPHDAGTQGEATSKD